MKIASRHLSGTYNFKAVPKFIENTWTPEQYTHISNVMVMIKFFSFRI